MNKNILRLSSLIIGISLVYMLLTAITVSQLKEKVMTQQPEIEQIDCVTRIGAWGDWFSEYVLEVKVDGKTYRIWVNDEGQIVDKELL